MNTLNLESFVDSNSLYYLGEVLGQLVFHSGLTVDMNPFNSSFVSLKSADDSYKLGNKVVSYPLYSREDKGTNN